jgi:4-hydroxy-2-oxoglutarate aldolase
MRKYRDTELSGFFTLGSNGENKSLTATEKLKILEVVLQEKAGHQTVMAGAGYESTRETVSFCKKVADLGADFVSILTPSYFKKQLTDDALIGYYTDIANSVSIPVLIYNAPGFTGVTLSPYVIKAVSEHPNIAGMKDTSAGNMNSYLVAASDDFCILAGSVATLFTVLVLGGSGGVVSLANAFPASCCGLYTKFTSGDLEGARKLHYVLFKLNQSVSGSFGVAGVKYAMDVAGYYGGDPRLPLVPLNQINRRIVFDAISKSKLLSTSL